MCPITVRCGDGKFSGDGGAEYPCVTRYRHRRLFTLLWLQGFRATHDSMLGESDAIMSVPHLQQLVLRDRWLDAHGYLSRFLRRGTSVEAVILTRFFRAFSKLAPLVLRYGREVNLSKETICQGQTWLRSIRIKFQQARESIDWERVKQKAADIVYKLAFATPELIELIVMPRGPMMLHDVLPIGFGFRQRFRPKKLTRQPKSALGVAKSYHARRQRIPASSGSSQETTYNQKLTFVKALYRIADIFDECLKAGKLEVQPLQTTETEGTTTAPVLQTVSSGLTWPGIPSDANAGAIAAPHSQTMVGSLAGSVINPVVTSVENAGALVAPVSHDLFVTAEIPLANAGKSVCHALTPGDQSTAVGCLTSPAKSSELPLMTNAESGCQELNLRKNPREEATSDDQDLHLERQRTTGAFSHAGLTPAAKIPTPVSSPPGAAAGRAPRVRRHRLAVPQRVSSRLAEKETAGFVPVAEKAINRKALRERRLALPT